MEDCESELSHLDFPCPEKYFYEGNYGIYTNLYQSVTICRLFDTSHICEELFHEIMKNIYINK